MTLQTIHFAFTLQVGGKKPSVKYSEQGLAPGVLCLATVMKNLREAEGSLEARSWKPTWSLRK